MKISKIIIAGLASTCMTISAMAEVANPVNTSIPTTNAIVFNNHLDSADLSYAFGGSENLQIQAMTSQEMDETQGAVLPFVAVTLMGGAVSAWSNHVESLHKTGNFASTGSTLKATGIGIATGAAGGVGTGALRPVVGTRANWIRVGDSFNKSQQAKTYAIRWGSNRHFQKQIGNDRVRSINNALHEKKLPGSSWRVQDKSHFHLWKK